jgi:hypothetical protein
MVERWTLSRVTGRSSVGTAIIGQRIIAMHPVKHASVQKMLNISVIKTGRKELTMTHILEESKLLAKLRKEREEELKSAMWLLDRIDRDTYAKKVYIAGIITLAQLYERTGVK